MLSEKAKELCLPPLQGPLLVELLELAQVLEQAQLLMLEQALEQSWPPQEECSLLQRRALLWLELLLDWVQLREQASLLPLQQADVLPEVARPSPPMQWLGQVCYPQGQRLGPWLLRQWLGLETGPPS